MNALAPIRQFAAQSGRSDSIRDLCLALAHRLETGRVFLILTSYFDESGTHDGSPVTVMAAILGNVGHWSKFQRELDRLKKQYGFRVFHTTEFKRKSGEFAGWSNEKCMSLISELSQLTADGLMHGTVFVLENAAYEEEYKGQKNPKKLRLDSRYGLCFRCCLRTMVLEIIRRLSHHKKFPETRLNIVMESGHRNAGDAERIFAEEKRGLGSAGSLLAGITFADKAECDPLMVADFLAHSAFMRGGDPPQQLPQKQIEEMREKTGLTYVFFEPGGLAQTKDAMLKGLEAKQAWGASRQPSSWKPRA
jgi:hypothetical protein